MLRRLKHGKLAADYLENLIACRIDKKMAAREHGAPEGSSRSLTPRRDIGLGHIGIRVAAHSEQGTGQTRTRKFGIGLAQLEIRTQHWQKELNQLGVFE